MEQLNNEWQKSEADVFWGEIAPCDHLVQIYEHDREIVNALGHFTESGIKAGESVILIATTPHMKSLERRLKKKKYNLEDLKSKGQYTCLNAEEVLAQFMKTGWPDEKLFNYIVNDIISKARGPNNRKVRAYGEMVAILWAQGYNGATVQLEHLWNKLCEKEKFSLFCAYPKSGFTQDIHKSIAHICSEHSKIISTGSIAKQKVLHKDIKANSR